MKTLFKKCLGAEYIHTDKGGDYSLAVEGDTLYLLFEWSDGREDWISNFNFPAKPYKRMSEVWFCHRGFLQVWKAMRDEIEEKVANILNDHSEITKIVCVGYSHGGAIALFATEDMTYLYGEAYTVEGYGFGAPRVIWGHIPKAVKNRLQAFKVIRNIPDIVTHLPPFLFGFRHAGTLIKVGEKGKYSPIKAHYDSAYIDELNSLKGGKI